MAKFVHQVNFRRYSSNHQFLRTIPTYYLLVFINLIVIKLLLVTNLIVTITQNEYNIVIHILLTTSIILAFITPILILSKRKIITTTICFIILNFWNIYGIIDTINYFICGLMSITIILIAQYLFTNDINEIHFINKKNDCVDSYNVKYIVMTIYGLLLFTIICYNIITNNSGNYILSCIILCFDLVIILLFAFIFQYKS